MTLTPLDIHNKEFGYKLRGYNEAEVDEFLDQVVKEFEALIRENAELKDRLDEMEQALERYRTIEDSLNKTLLLAQKAAEEVRTTGEKEADVIREKALMEAQRIVDEARARAKKAVADYTEMRREAELFRLRMKTMLQAQLEIFEEDALRAADANDTPFATSERAARLTRDYAADDDDEEGPATRLTGLGRLAGPERAGSRPEPEDEPHEPRQEAATRDYRRAEPVRPNLWGEPVAPGRPFTGRVLGSVPPEDGRPGDEEPEDGDAGDGKDQDWEK